MEINIETKLKHNRTIYRQFWPTADAKKIASLDALERDFKRVTLIFRRMRGKARTTRAWRNLWHAASTSSEIVVELHIEMETNERMNARTNERTHDGAHGSVCCFSYLLLFVLFRFVVDFSSAIIRANERRRTWIRLFLYLLLFVLFCFVLLFFSSAINPWRADHRRPKEWTTEEGRRTKKWTLKPAWNIIGTSVANLDPQKHLPIWVLGPWGEIWRGFRRVRPQVPSGFLLESPWEIYCQFPELFKNLVYFFMEVHWNLIER